MNSEDLQKYLLPVLALAFFGWKFWQTKKMKAELPKHLNKGAIIVDVRTPGEFQAGHNPASINIPLGSLPARIKELDKTKPIILCCASGGRSGMAVGTLKEHGFTDVINAGPWRNTLS